jgi:hypothetical protein
MKELLGQGLEASKKIASKAGVKAQDLGEKGFKASKAFMVKAGARAQDLGERGVLIFEIKQLERQAKKLMGRLGLEVYGAFAEKGAKTISSSSPALKPILAGLASIKIEVEKRERELEKRKKAPKE